MPDNSGIRINKYLASKGLCSRREAEVLIQKGWVQINGETLSELSYRVQQGDDVQLSPQAMTHLHKKLTLVLNKPVGYVSAQAEKDYLPAIRLIKKQNYSGDQGLSHFSLEGMAPAGRLDIDSTGLLILTQDGRVAKAIIGESSNVEKEYLIDVKGELTKEKIVKLRQGLKLDGEKLRPAIVTQLNLQHFKMILKQGKKRQIRRMCELVDLEVTHLKRVRIGSIRLGSLPLGQWRWLTPQEKQSLL